MSCRGDERSLADCYHSGWGRAGALCRRADGDDYTNAVTVECREPALALRCRQDFWLCAQQSRCIHYELLCDGRPDCADGSDEWAWRCTKPVAFRLATGVGEEDGGSDDGDDDGGGDGARLTEGRVEVRFKGVWGAVCDTQFGRREATVHCRSLGFASGQVGARI